MSVYHLIVDSILPNPDGLSLSARRVAGLLARSGATVNVVSRFGGPETSESPRYLDFAGARAVAEAPLLGRGLLTPFTLAAERTRLDYLRLRDLVERERPKPQVLISFGMTNCGFVAQQVALATGIPHVTSPRGNDFAASLLDSFRLPALEYVARRAARIVTTNHEQKRLLVAAFDLDPKRVACVHGALGVDAPRHEGGRPERLRLFADCGYAYKKGTHILVEAVRRLAGERPLSLTLMGPTEPERKLFWQDLRARAGEPFFHFHDWVPRESVLEQLRTHDIYCSATLGEGCSQARMAALCSGIPLVTTDCGEIADVAKEASHVAVARCGDVEDFLAALRRTCAAVSDGSLGIDQQAVARWREHFSPAREAAEWGEALRGLP